MTYDALVVGAGIAGLVAALRLQSAGFRTVVVEKSNRAGGLCGTFEHDGFEFVIGCNDFGSGFERMLVELGVDIAFLHPRARFHFDAHRIELPPNVRTLAHLAWRMPSIARALRGAKRVTTLGEFVDRSIPDPLLADLACLPAFAMMRSPDDVPLSALKADFSKELGYGYDKSCTPVGGPQVLVDRMVARFEALGGKLLPDHECHAIARSGEYHVVRTQHRELRASAVLSSEGRWKEYPAEAKPGLDVGLVLLVVRADCAFPPGFHTLDWFTPNVARMLRELDAGNYVDEPSFHTFRSDLAVRDGCYTLNAFVPLPRGEHDPSAARRRALAVHVQNTVARIIPGFECAIDRATFMSPLEYHARFGFWPRPSVRILPAGKSKPASWDAVGGVHFLGTSVEPPGEHAGAAALSGWRAAERVLAMGRERAPSHGAEAKVSEKEHQDERSV